MAGATGGSCSGGGVFVGECQRRPGLAQVPDEVGGEEADQDVCADPVVEVVVDGAQVQVDGFEGAEVAFDGERFL